MFGYIVPEKPELKIREYETYRAYYCGVCKSIGRRSGQLPRLTLTYDAAFLALILTSLDEKDTVFKRQRCIAHPAKRKGMAAKDDIIEYASDINILLSYYNLDDNWRDEKSIVSGMGKIALSRAFRKIKARYGEKCSNIEKQLRELSKLESENCSSTDEAAEPFAKLMEEVFSYPGLKDEAALKTLRWMGYNIGRWIYILDAFDDITKDIEKGSYNPLVRQYGYDGGDTDEFRNKVKGRVEFSLTYTLNEISKAYELLSPKRNQGIIENIFYLGMLKKTDTILNTGSCRKIEKSI